MKACPTRTFRRTSQKSLHCEMLTSTTTDTQPEKCVPLAVVVRLLCPFSVFCQMQLTMFIFPASYRNVLVYFPVVPGLGGPIRTRHNGKLSSFADLANDGISAHNRKRLYVSH